MNAPALLELAALLLSICDTAKPRSYCSLCSLHGKLDLRVIEQMVYPWAFAEPQQHFKVCSDHTCLKLMQLRSTAW